jgi:hypothetical protein
MSTASPRLTPDQLAAYHRDGYLIYPTPVIAAPKFLLLQQHFDDALRNLPAGERPEAMDVPHFTDTALFEWLFDDDVLDLVEPITGPDIALFSSHFICKPQGTGKRVPWHEDSAYWRGTFPTMDTIVSLWLAIDPSLPENGCMYVIPGSHRRGKRGFSDYEAADTRTNVFDSEIVPHQRNAAAAVPCVLQPNQASLHDARTIHGSQPNTSGLRRCGYTMRYMSSALALSAAAQEYHQVYLARGRDLAGQRYGDPRRPATDLYAHRLEMRKKGH